MGHGVTGRSCLQTTRANRRLVPCALPARWTALVSDHERLNVVVKDGVRSYANEYVAHGMLRFIRGQYSSTVRHGGMLGYVLDRQISNAINNVTSVIQARRVDLRMEAPGTLFPSSVRAADSRFKETHHTREHNNKGFAIHHIFVAPA